MLASLPRNYSALLLISTIVAAVDIIDYFHNPATETVFKSRKTTAQRISEHGYPAETHHVVTEDGYIITLYRIPHSPKMPSTPHAARPIVLLQHGLYCCSDIWVVCGPNDGLPFLLADDGFDVWLANARGNAYARNHTQRPAYHPHFWRFSWHEIGHYDLAAMIDYALASSGNARSSLHYVGHSQGTTTLLVLLSTRPEYNAKVSTAHLLAPVAFMAHVRDKLVHTLAPYLSHTNVYTAFLGSREFVPYNQLFTLLTYNACASSSQFFQLCSGVAYLLEGDNAKVNQSAMEYVAETHPAGGSTDQICHYMQSQQSGRFRHFDWGAKGNLEVYGQETPPDYELTLITAELHLWYSDNDDMAAVPDVKQLADLLPNKVMHRVVDPLWTHGDYVFALELQKHINAPLVALMRQYEAQLET